MMQPCKGGTRETGMLYFQASVHINSPSVKPGEEILSRQSSPLSVNDALLGVDCINARLQLGVHARHQVLRVRL